MSALSLSPRTRHRAVTVIDGLMVVWVVGWVIVGFFVGLNVHELRQFSDTTDAAAEALAETSDALSSLSGLPVIGDDIGAIAQEVEDTAASARQSAVRSRENVADLAWLLGVVIVVIPSVPALAVWIPFRVRRAHELRAVRHALEAGPSPAAVDEYLARRAVANLDYHELRAITEHPWDDLHGGDFRALADAELRRLGIERPPPG